MSVKRLAEIYAFMLNIAYEGHVLDPGEEQRSRRGGPTLPIRDLFVHRMVEQLEADANMLAGYYERKLERFRAVDVVAWRNAKEEGV